MRYYSPYSSRTRPPVWPRFLMVFLAIAVLGGGGWAFFALRDSGSGNPAQQIRATVGAPSAPADTPAAAAPATPASNATLIPPAANGTVAITSNALSSPQSAADTYVQAWNASDYLTMYRVISTRAQSAITQQAFQDRYQGILAESGITAVQVSILGQEPGTTQYRIKASFASSLVGNIDQENVIPLTQEG